MLPWERTSNSHSWFPIIMPLWWWVDCLSYYVSMAKWHLAGSI